jgi:hypothetical protein
MNLSKKILLVLICLAIFGCFKREAYVPIEIKNLIIEGKTTKQEVLDILGEPTSKTTLPHFKLVSSSLDIPQDTKKSLLSIEENMPVKLKGGEIWSYTQIRTVRGLFSNTFASAYLMVVFDLDGVVSKLSYKSNKARY